jgi:uncharacterized damage-inducible protein DinB
VTGPGLSAAELLAWNQRTIDGWKALIAHNPAVLNVPCDVYGVTSLRELLRHIIAVELRYAQRLKGIAESPYGAVGLQPEQIFATHDQAQSLLQSCVDDPAFDWSLRQEFITISWGRVHSHRNTMFAHAILHGIRHFAQAAMLARQAGFKPDWPMDYLAMDAEKVEA